MLDAGREPALVPDIFSLKALHHGCCQPAVKVRVLARRLHDTSPPRVPDQIRHRGKCHLDTARSRLLSSRLGTALRGLGRKCRTLSERTWKHGLVTMYNIKHKHERYPMWLCFHIFILNFLQLLCPPQAESASCQPAGLLTPAVVHSSGDHRFFLVAVSRNLHELSYLLLKRHISEKFIKFILCHINPHF